MTLLAPDFEPGASDVICGRGKKCYSHIGNENFKRRVEGMLDEYAKAKSKLDKSGVLASVVDQIRAASPNGGFVKQDDNGRWYEVGDFLAREKTSQAFRDALHERYKSSNVAKKKRRQEEQSKAHDKFRRIARSYSDDTAQRLEWLSLSEVGGMGGMGLPGTDPRFQSMYGRGQSIDAAARLSRLAEMRSRLSRRFGVRPPPTARPNSAMSARYPDPLLGPMSSTRNAFPSHVASYGADNYGEMDLYDLARREESAEDEYSEQEAMHHSMPNIHMSSTWNPYDVDVEPSLHHSAPDLMCTESFHHSTPNLKLGEGGDESLSSDMDPIPLDQYTPKPFPKKKLGGEEFKKAISMTLSPTSPSAEAVSRDLIACLEKLTGSSIKDENPFEPLPLEVGMGITSH